MVAMAAATVEGLVKVASVASEVVALAAAALAVEMVGAKVVVAASAVAGCSLQEVQVGVGGWSLGAEAAEGSAAEGCSLREVQPRCHMFCQHLARRWQACSS